MVVCAAELAHGDSYRFSTTIDDQIITSSLIPDGSDIVTMKMGLTDGTNTIDAAGNVYVLAYDTLGDWIQTKGTSGMYEVFWVSNPSEYPTIDRSCWAIQSNLQTPLECTTNYYATNFTVNVKVTSWGAKSDVSFIREYVGRKKFVGKLAQTNDIPPAVTVVAPSTNATAGTAADARATGTALYTGFTEWEFSDRLEHSLSIEKYYDEWYYSLDDFIYSIEAFASKTDALAALSLKFVGYKNVITATRHLVTPTKTSQLENDTLVPRLTDISYQDLVDLCSSNKLIPGAQYRITNYVATTIQENTSSASNQFDIIVVADSTNILNEVARAALHDGDKYFADSRLESWQVWYSISNDPQRFGWADVQNGRGVVYRLIDENKNDLPYDFKSIQFQRWPITDVILMPQVSGNHFSSLKGLFPTNSQFNNFLCYSYSSGRIDYEHIRFLVDGNGGTNHYTFSSEDLSDASVSNVCVWSNTIKPYKINDTFVLNNIVFVGCGIVLENTGAVCNNYFGANVSSCTLGYETSNNYLAGDCSNNLFYGCLHYNRIEHEFRNNTIGGLVYRNRFGYNFRNNVLETDIEHNTFGDKVSSSMFGGIFTYSKIGSMCTGIYIGSVCEYINIGDECWGIYFGKRGQSSSDSLLLGSKYNNITIEPYNRYIDLYATNAIANGVPYQNVTLKARLNKNYNVLTIVDTNTNQTANTVYSPKGSQVIEIE